MSIRGENVLEGYNTTTQLSASIPLSIAATQTSLAESIRGQGYDGPGAPFHDHAHQGSRIDRSVIATIDGGAMSPAISIIPPVINTWYGVEPGGWTHGAAEAFAVANKPAKLVGPNTIGYSCHGIDGKTSIGGNPPRVAIKGLIRLYGTGQGQIRIYSRQTQGYIDSPVFNATTLQWFDFGNIEILAGLNEFDIFIQVDTLLGQVDILSLIFAETRTQTQPQSQGSFNLNTDPRP